MNEAQRRRIDAVTQAAAIARAIFEDMAEMAVARSRAHFGAGHAMRHVAQLIHVRRLDRPGEARPAAAGFELVA